MGLSPGYVGEGGDQFRAAVLRRRFATVKAIDRHILRSLQADGRATYDQLPEEVSLSARAVLRRVKRLEEARVIDRYVALVKPVGWA